ncbi:MAG: DUF362 domain-containing protein [Nanoarchaeota archaeon]|nr:DUF362 domain-containing protein [Nanoarchaeota archaeon]MBU1704641.1 DUF362 domain-containing protein [Nanoarchaeota archaeon]
MIERWKCKKCDKKWIYPVDRCIYCGEPIEIEVGTKTKVMGVTKISIPSPEHPIIPYYTLILEDEHGNKMPKKVMNEYKIGDEFKWEASDDENAVSIIKIKYDHEFAVKKAIELVGGLKLDENTKVLIKPNIMTAAYSYYALTTNPKVIKALIDNLVAQKVSRNNITIAEQSQFAEFDKAVSRTGIAKLASDNGVKLVDIAKTEFVDKESGGFKFKVSKILYENDLIINVPVMKTHMLLGISGALENMTRVVSAETYKELQNDPAKALEAICHLHKVLPKYFTLADCSIGLQGNGPLNYGEPAFLNMIMASRDPVAVDKVFEEMGMLRKVPLTDTAERMGIGSADMREITVTGDQLDACKRELKPAYGSKLIKMR